jgi:hypothetical protein
MFPVAAGRSSELIRKLAAAKSPKKRLLAFQYHDREIFSGTREVLHMRQEDCVMLLGLGFNQCCEIVGRASAIIALAGMASLVLSATAVDVLRLPSGH